MDKFEIIKNMEERDITEISVNKEAYGVLDQKELIRFYGELKEIYGAWHSRRFNIRFNKHHYYLYDFLDLVEKINSRVCHKNNCNVIKISFRDCPEEDLFYFKLTIEFVTYRLYTALLEYFEVSLFGDTEMR